MRVGVWQPPTWDMLIVSGAYDAGTLDATRCFAERAAVAPFLLPLTTPCPSHVPLARRLAHEDRPGSPACHPAPPADGVGTRQRRHRSHPAQPHARRARSPGDRVRAEARAGPARPGHA